MARCEPFWNTVCWQSEMLMQETISTIKNTLFLRPQVYTEPLSVALIAFSDHSDSAQRSHDTRRVTFVATREGGGGGLFSPMHPV